MSTFLNITSYDANGREGGTIRRLRPGDLKQAVALLPNFKLIHEDKTWGVKLPGVDAIAVLEGGGTLSCQVDNQTDMWMLVDQLRTLASSLPNAVVEDEEGDTY